MTRILYLGGTGEISHACVQQALRAGQQVTVFNRGRRHEPLAPQVEQITGDLSDEAALAALAARRFDVVCQYLAYTEADVQRDIRLFSGNTGQYIFISSASAYRKPCGELPITEDTPLANPFWAYSRRKAACEALLNDAHAAGRLPVTIVRPSHTHRTRFPGTFIDGDHLAWRLLQGKPVIIHGDGQSLWALTHSQDYARAFVRLCGLDTARGQTYHITRDTSHTWDRIVGAIARSLGVQPTVVHIASDTLVRYQPDWAGPLLGDKSNTVIFDNRKVSDAVGGWRCELTMEQGIDLAAEHVRRRLAAGYRPDPDIDALVDRIVAEQQALGRP